MSVLLRALREVTDARDIRLTIVGDGPLRESLEHETNRLGIADRVEFTGSISSDALARRFAVAHEALLPDAALDDWHHYRLDWQPREAVFTVDGVERPLSYVRTIKGGTVTFEDGDHTGATPGTLLRGAR